MALPTVVRFDCFQRPPTVDTFVCAPTTTDGEVTEILLAASPLLLAELSDAVAFAARVDYGPDAVGDIIRIKCTGKYSAAEPATQRVEGGALVRNGKFVNTLEVEAFNDTDVNYNALREIQYGGGQFYMYFVMGGKLYGGAANVEDGISANLISLGAGEGAASLFKHIHKTTWETVCQPARVAYALAV